MACLCHKALYGLKQSGRAWYYEFRDTLTKIGFTVLISDPCVYYRHRGSGTTIIVTHVDDCKGLSSSESERETIQAELGKFYPYKTKSDPNKFLLLGLLVE